MDKLHSGGIRAPNGSIKKVETKGYPFGYVVRALLSDGTIYQQGSNYVCRLATKDAEFQSKFINCAEKIGLNTNCWYNKKSKIWMVTVYSKTLYNLLTSGKWRSSLMGPEERRGFLDGYFDGDGGGLLPSYISSDVRVLEYIGELLQKEGIRTSPPLVSVKSGMVNNGIKIIKTKHDVYITYIR